MKVNCAKKQVDLDKVLWAIEKFRAEHYGDPPSYIVMNYETRATLRKDYCYDLRIFDFPQEERLFDIPVALTEGLEFGEVDLV